jgi:hypothetical protein
MPNQNINWDKVPEWMNYLAMDSDGLWFGYAEEPYHEPGSSTWDYTGRMATLDRDVFTDFTATLTKRPNAE